jgi:hypothetical protein
MKFSIEQIEAIASRAPTMRANTLLHHLKRLEKAEELRAAQVDRQTDKKPLSFFERVIKGAWA